MTVVNKKIIVSSLDEHTLDITNMQVYASTNFYIRFLFYENGRDSKNVKKKRGDEQEAHGP